MKADAEPTREYEDLEPSNDGDQDVRAVIDSLNAILRGTTADDVIRSALDTIRQAFRWDYGSYWVVDPAQHDLTFALESGSVGDEFRHVTRSARFREGEGLNGRAWRQRDLVFVADLDELTDCPRAPAAQRFGVRSGLAMPLLRDGLVVGTMDFFAADSRAMTETRLAIVRTLVRVVSDKCLQLHRQNELNRISRLVENVPINIMYTDRDLRI